MAVTYTTPPSGAELDTGHSLYANLKSLIIVPRGTQTLDDLAAADSVSFSTAPSWVSDGDAGEVPSLSGQYITMPYSSSRLYSASYTVLLGFNPSGVDTPWGGTLCIESGGTANLSVQRNDSNTYYALYNSANNISLNATGILISDYLGAGYTVFALTYNSGTTEARCFLGDTTVVDSLFVAARSSLTSGNLRFFCEASANPSYGTDGTFCWFAYFDTNLSNANVQSIAADPWQLVVEGGASAEGGGMLLGSRRNRLTIP